MLEENCCKEGSEANSSLKEALLQDIGSRFDGTLAEEGKGRYKTDGSSAETRKTEPNPEDKKHHQHKLYGGSGIAAPDLPATLATSGKSADGSGAEATFTHSFCAERKAITKSDKDRSLSIYDAPYAPISWKDAGRHELCENPDLDKRDPSKLRREERRGAMTRKARLSETRAAHSEQQSSEGEKPAQENAGEEQP